MSNQDFERYRAIIENLERDDHRPIALNDIMNFLLLKPAGEAVATMRNVGISKIVQCLDAQDRKHIVLTCEVLQLCFNKFSNGEVVRNYTPYIMFLLRHDNACVKGLAVDEVYKAISSDANLLPLSRYIDVFVAVAQLVSDKDIGVANKAIMITSNLPYEAYDKILDEMKIALECGNNSKANAYEVIINISTKSYELMKLCEEHGYIDGMLSDLESNDVLYQLNILELLSRLSVKSHGINFLVNHGALQKISSLVADLKNSPLGALTIPGYMKFFGCIAHHYPKEIFEKYPNLMDLLFESFESSDRTILPVALDTLGFIGMTSEGKLCLAAVGAKYIQTVEKLGDMIRNSPTEVKIRALHCFTNLIAVEGDNVPPTRPIDHRITLMTREWFRSISKQPSSMDVLLQLCKNPFPDIKIVAYNLLDAVCQHQWGEELVARTAGFIEYLLDRRLEEDKNAKEAKYDIIKRLSRSLAFDESMINRLQEYVDQGPFHSESGLEVAMEEGD